MCTENGWALKTDGWTHVVPTTLTECPCCGNPDTTTGGCYTTLVGFSGGPWFDGNHVTESRSCSVCGKSWVREWVVSKRSIWLADKSRIVLKGKPGCCVEGYSIPCDCGGLITHSRKGKIIVFTFGAGYADPMFWKCNACGKELPDLHAEAQNQATIETAKNPIPTIPWMVQEVVGMGMVNTNSIKNLALEK